MSDRFIPYLKDVTYGKIFLRDYQHATRLYLDNGYQFVPKAAWIYYIEIKINPEIVNYTDSKNEFQKWYNDYNGAIGLLAKSVTMPKFTIENETINQYNKKTVIQKSIKYQSVSFTFHDDMSNATTNLWKSYYEYYFGDSNENIASKYSNTKYNRHDGNNSFRYGLNNNQRAPFFTSFDVYQLFKSRYNFYRIVNPIIKEWSHSDLNQSEGNKLSESTLIADYETVVYDTDLVKNKSTKEEPGFYNQYYDKTPPILGINRDSPSSPSFPGPQDIYPSTDMISPGIMFAGVNPRNKARSNLNFNIAGQAGSFVSNLSSNDGVVLSFNLSNDSGNNPAGINVPLGNTQGDNTPAELRTTRI